MDDNGELPEPGEMLYRIMTGAGLSYLAREYNRTCAEIKEHIHKPGSWEKYKQLLQDRPVADGAGEPIEFNSGLETLGMIAEGGCMDCMHPNEAAAILGERVKELEADKEVLLNEMENAANQIRELDAALDSAVDDVNEKEAHMYKEYRSAHESPQYVSVEDYLPGSKS